MPVVDVNAGTDAELILALSEAGIKLEVVPERIVDLRRAQPFASVRDLAERVNALARVVNERLGKKQLPALRCSAPADVPASKRRRLLAANINVPSAPAPSNVQLARQIAAGWQASGQSTITAHAVLAAHAPPPCSPACLSPDAHTRDAAVLWLQGGRPNIWRSIVPCQMGGRSLPT